MAATSSAPSAALEGKVALVTGGAGAIGSAICRCLAEDGLKVAVVDREQAACDDVAASLPGKSGHIGAAINVADEESIDRGTRYVVDKLGDVDVLVNVAGVLSNAKLEETSADEWRRLHAVNVDGPFFLMKALIPAMRRKGWGRIVNVSSYAWKSGGLTSGTAYSSSKAALVGLTFTVARETAAQGITCNAIAPAYVQSKMVSEQLSEEQRRSRLELIPVKRFCDPDEVAHAVRFLVHPLAGFVTGEVLDMNGGLQFG